MEIETLEQKVSYIYGREIALELAKKIISKNEYQNCPRSHHDTFMQKEWPFDPSENEQLKQQMEDQRKETEKQLKQQQTEFEQAFFKKNGQRREVTTHSSGIQYEILKEGNELASVSSGTQCKVRHKTWLLNGRQVDSSVHLPEPLTISLNQAPVSWLVVLKQMKLGSTWRLYVPAHLAYKEDEHPRIPEETAVVFELSLVSI